MKSRMLASAAALVLLATCAPSVPRFAITHAEKRGVIESNGLRFVIMPDPTTQLVEVDVRYDVGAKEDPPGKAGIAHLVEHMMFQIRPDGPGTPPLMHSLGQITTFFNAYTSPDSTHYQAAARAEFLEALIKIDAMRMFFRCQKGVVPESEFLRERDVVRNEIRQRGGTPEGQIPQLVLSQVYPRGHAYEQSVGGNDAQLSTITFDDVCEFMDKYYTPDRATVIIAGGVDVEKTTELVTRFFGKMPRRTPAPKHEPEPITLKPEVKTVKVDLERPWLLVTWAIPPDNTKEGELARYGINNAFFRTASRARQYDFATAVQPAFFGGQGAPVFTMAIELKSMSRKAEAEEFVWNAVKEAHRGLDEGSWQDLEESRNRRKADIVEGLETLGARTNFIGDKVQFDLDFDFASSELYLFNELDKIGKMDPAAAAGVVKRTLDRNKAKVLILEPNKEGIQGDRRSGVKFQTQTHSVVEVAEVDPKEAHTAIKVESELGLLGRAERFQLGNGMQVVMLPVDSMPLVAVNMLFGVGSSATPDNPALASAAATFLSLPRDADAMGRTGIFAGCNATADSTMCSTSGVNIYLDVMLKTIERLIAVGEYEQESIEAWQKDMADATKRASAAIDTEFERATLEGIFGADHPYTKTGYLTGAAAQRVSRDALDTFREKHYRAGNATLVIAGNFDPARAKALARSTFGGWSKTSPDAPVPPTPFTRSGPTYVGVVGRESTPQMSVSISFPAPAGIDDNEAVRRVLTEMLNRRVGDIRFKLGSTYGIYARRDTRLGPARYVIGGNVDVERAGESLKAMRESVESLRRGDDFEVEFVRARRAILQRLLGESTVSKELAGRLSTLAVYGLPTDFYNTILQQVASVSPEAVKALLKNELDPAGESIVTTAGRAHLEKAFAEAGITNVRIIEPIKP